MCGMAYCVLLNDCLMNQGASETGVSGFFPIVSDKIWGLRVGFTDGLRFSFVCPGLCHWQFFYPPLFFFLILKLRDDIFSGSAAGHDVLSFLFL